jgi:hypothetical protein
MQQCGVSLGQNWLITICDACSLVLKSSMQFAHSAVRQMSLIDPADAAAAQPFVRSGFAFSLEGSQDEPKVNRFI